MSSQSTLEDPPTNHAAFEDPFHDSADVRLQMFRGQPIATYMSEFFLKEIEEEIEHYCPNAGDMKVYMHHLSMSLLMNELELVAWMHVLKQALYGEAQDRQLRTLQYSAYLSKSLMCRDMSLFEAAVRREDPGFISSFENWRVAHRRLTELTIRDLHNQFKEMWLKGKQSAGRENLNSVVDSIVQTKVEENERPQDQFVLPEVVLSPAASFDATGSGLLVLNSSILGPISSITTSPLPRPNPTPYILDETLTRSNSRLFNQ